MVDDKQLYSNEKENSKCTNSSSPTASSHPRDILKSSNSIESPPTNSEGNFQSLLARLHAELLSALLSHGQVSPPHPAPLIDGLSSDDVAVLVASLIAYGRKVGVAGGGVMEESVERFAQFLQISMSAKMLQLKPGNFLSIMHEFNRSGVWVIVVSDHAMTVVTLLFPFPPMQRTSNSLPPLSLATDYWNLSSHTPNNHGT